MDRKENYPLKTGKIDIFPKVEDGNVITVTIIGDPKGLRYLAELLNYLAEFDPKKTKAPNGSREHIHLHVGEQLGIHSCEVEICRADAKNTGELPEFMRTE